MIGIITDIYVLTSKAFSEDVWTRLHQKSELCHIVITPLYICFVQISSFSGALFLYISHVILPLQTWNNWNTDKYQSVSVK